MGNITQPIALEVLVLLCIAPCLVSWALGQAHGAWRAGHRIDGQTAKHGKGLESVMFAAPPIPKRRARDPGTPVRPQADTRRSDAFAGAPTLRELRDQAEAMRQSKMSGHYEIMAEALADDHLAMAKAVEDFRYSVAALHQTNRRRSIGSSQTLDNGIVLEVMPRIADVAPVCPRLRMSELASQREVDAIPVY